MNSFMVVKKDNLEELKDFTGAAFVKEIEHESEPDSWHVVIYRPGQTLILRENNVIHRSKSGAIYSGSMAIVSEDDCYG